MCVYVCDKVDSTVLMYMFIWYLGEKIMKGKSDGQQFHQYNKKQVNILISISDFFKFYHFNWS